MHFAHAGHREMPHGLIIDAHSKHIYGVYVWNVIDMFETYQYMYFTFKSRGFAAHLIDLPVCSQCHWPLHTATETTLVCQFSNIKITYYKHIELHPLRIEKLSVVNFQYAMATIQYGLYYISSSLRFCCKE